MNEEKDGFAPKPALLAGTLDVMADGYGILAKHSLYLEQVLQDEQKRHGETRWRLSGTERNLTETKRLAARQGGKIEALEHMLEGAWALIANGRPADDRDDRGDWEAHKHLWVNEFNNLTGRDLHNEGVPLPGLLKERGER